MIDYVKGICFWSGLAFVVGGACTLGVRVGDNLYRAIKMRSISKETKELLKEIDGNE